MDFEKDFPHSRICWECAIAKGGKMPAGNCNTVSEEVCPYCDKKTGVLALRDFNWPKYKKGHIWD